MSRVHGVEEVECLAAADLADHDPVGRHAQRLVDQHLDPDRAPAFGVGRARLQRNAVGQLAPEVQLRLVLDGDQPLGLRDQPAEHAHERGLAGAGAAGHQDVEASSHRGFQERRQREG